MNIADLGTRSDTLIAVRTSVKPQTIQLLADRLFRKCLALQYVDETHPFLTTENELVGKSVMELRAQTRGFLPLDLVHVHIEIVEAARVSAATSNADDVDDDTMKNAFERLESESIKLMSRFALSEC